MLLTEKVKVKWHGNNRKHFESLGYVYTKRGDEFEISVDELPSGSNVRIDVRCDYCGVTYETRYCDFLKGRKAIKKDACSSGTCHHMKASEIRDGYYTTVADIPNLLNEWHELNKVDPSRVLTGSGKKYRWKCSADESHTWKASAVSRTKGSGCPSCAGKFSEPLSVTHNHLVAEWCESNDRSPNEVTAGSAYRAEWKCSTCNHEWKATVNKRANGRGCPVCRESKGEKRVAELLESMNVNFAREYEFPAQKLKGVNNGYLRYDIAFFHDNSLAGLVEIDGEFHRRNVYGDEEGARRLTAQQEHDRLKDGFAYYEDIPLFRIEYDKGAFKDSDIKKLKEFVESCLSFEKLIQSLG